MLGLRIRSEISKGRAQVYEFTIVPGRRFTVGRGEAADFRIPEDTISRLHAVLEVRDGGLIIEDTGSLGGVWVAGKRVASATLAAGDLMRLADITFVVEALAVSVPIATSPMGSPFGSAPTPQPERGSGTQVIAIPMMARLRVDGGSEEELRLQHLLDVAIDLTRAGSVRRLLDRIVNGSFALFKADRCVLLLVDEHGNLQPALARDQRGQEAPPSVPRSITQRAMAERTAIRADDAGSDERFERTHSVIVQQVRSVMVAPLVASDERILGVVYVDNFLKAHLFTESDLLLLRAFAGIAAAAIENGQLVERVRLQAIAQSNFERYFPPQLAARIAASPESVRLGGDRRNVAVLFSDIRGFTAMSEVMAPDELASFLSDYLREMVECVFRHGGTLDKFIGDALMAQWGAPIAGARDADGAMAAALDMMQVLARLNDDWRAQGRATLQIGIGLNYGEAFAGNIGSERRLEYTVIGDTVNTASRLCSKAGAGEILLSAAFRTALAEPPPMELLPPLEVKGKQLPLTVFRIR